jgi:hypothetical protein
MKGILLLVLGICFVASVTAAASTDINFYFSGMIPASAMSGGDDYQEISQGGYEVRTSRCTFHFFVLSYDTGCRGSSSRSPSCLHSVGLNSEQPVDIPHST